MGDFNFQQEFKEYIPNLHPDYNNNLEFGAKFTKNYNDTCGDKFFTIKMSKSLDNIKYYFSFSFFVPPSYGIYTSYGNVVDPNKDQFTFMKEFKATFFEYRNLQKNYEIKNLDVFTAKAR